MCGVVGDAGGAPHDYGRNRGLIVIDATTHSRNHGFLGSKRLTVSKTCMNRERVFVVSRREFGQGLMAGAIGFMRTNMATPRMPSSRTQAGSGRRPLTVHAVAGIRLIDSTLARAATDLCRDASPPYLFNHAMRTYLFGALIGRAKKQTWDAEVLYLACVLHDLGLTSRFAGDMPFELQGADAAAQFLQRAGLTGRRLMTVWDGIAMHPYAIADHKSPEIALVAAGAAADVTGADLARVPAHDRDHVIRAYPRLRFKSAFVSTCADVVRKHPRGASRSFMRDIGERYVSDFRVRNICDAIEASPFDE